MITVRDGLVTSGEVNCEGIVHLAIPVTDEKWTPIHNTRFEEVSVVFAGHRVIIRDAVVWTLPGMVDIAQRGQNLPSLTLMDGDAEYTKCGNRLTVKPDEERS